MSQTLCLELYGNCLFELSQQPMFSIHEEVNRAIRKQNQASKPGSLTKGAIISPERFGIDYIFTLHYNHVYTICVCFGGNLYGEEFSLLSTLK